MGYTNGRKAIIDHVDQCDKITVTIRYGNNQRGNPNKIVINESGLYSLILGSKLPKAKKFKRWVTSEVLPSIRKMGGYVSNEDLFVNTYLPFADENTKNLFRLQLNTITQLNRKLKRTSL